VMFPTDRQRYSAEEDPPGLPGSAMPSEPELAARFWDRIRLFAARRVQDAAMAEDIAQETLRRVIEALRAGRIEKPEAIAGFVFQTAKHICMHAQRSAGREALAFRRLQGRSDSADVRPDALARLVSEERCALVQAALQSLSSDDRDLLRAVYFDQIDSGELAEQLGLSLGALRVRKHRALQRLAEALGARRSDETLSTERELKR
jgi:RNA polymerase sigma-70 factor (ECF subfamily)